MGAKANYSPDHVRALIEEYQALSQKVDTDHFGLNFLVQFADLNRVLDSLPPSYWEVILVHGLAGLPLRAAGVVLGCSYVTVKRRYDNALAEIHHQLNGGTA